MAALVVFVSASCLPAVHDPTAYPKRTLCFSEAKWCFMPRMEARRERLLVELSFDQRLWLGSYLGSHRGA
jgi:hypothetical protein